MIVICFFVLSGVIQSSDTPLESSSHPGYFSEFQDGGAQASVCCRCGDDQGIFILYLSF